MMKNKKYNLKSIKGHFLGKKLRVTFEKVKKFKYKI